MNLKKKWLSFWPLVAIVILIGVIFLLGRIGAHIDGLIIENGKKTTGILFDARKRFVKIRYEVDGKEYVRGIANDISNIEDGEEYELVYLPSDPEQVVVLFDRPVLSDKYSYTDVNCSSVEKTLSIIEFEYIVRGEVIRRNALFNNHSLNSDDYLVRYRTNNAKIGYLVEK